MPYIYRSVESVEASMRTSPLRKWVLEAIADSVRCSPGWEQITTSTIDGERVALLGHLHHQTFEIL